MRVLEVEGVSLRFGSVSKLHSCSFHTEEKEIFGLLGQNGSGKSSLIKSLMGLNSPYEGRMDFSCKRDEVGYVPQHYAFYPEYSVEENINFFRSLAKRSRPAAEIMKQFELADFRHVRAERLSGGYKRLLNIAVTVVRPLRLLILDEPTANMDVVMRHRIMDIVRGIRDTGVSVLFTTHHMEEAARYCDRVALISEGKIRATGTVEELVSRYGGDYSVNAKIQEAGPLAASLKKAGFSPQVEGRSIRTKIPKELGNAGTIRALRIYSKFPISSLSVEEPSLSKVIEGLNKNA
jgi:ABC-2 type transport system ATP-binding protein